MMINISRLIVLTIFFTMFLPLFSSSHVDLGIDRYHNPKYLSLLKGKRIGLVTNHTAVNGKMESTIEIFKKESKAGTFHLSVLFAPEHGLKGNFYAGELVDNSKDLDGIPIYSLHGKTRRPTQEMLKQVDLIVYDIQDIGSRSYTYVTTLFYVMEECAKEHIPVIVLDRPNALNGLIVDGPMLEEQHRSFLGYVNIPYCHGMTIGELAQFFNGEYNVGCQLSVVPMQGWRREMSFEETGLPWIPTSPHIPEATTAYYYPTTGILGELSIVNIGIGFTLPFKILGAPWIEATKFAKALNAQKFPGVHFEPFHYTPFYGKFAKEPCQGALIVVTDKTTYRPFKTAYLIIGILKSLYPQKFAEALESRQSKKDSFIRLVGSKKIYQIISEEKNIVWKLRNLHEAEHAEFLSKREKYLIHDYASKPST